MEDRKGDGTFSPRAGANNVLSPGDRDASFPPCQRSLKGGGGGGHSIPTGEGKDTWDKREEWFRNKYSGRSW